MQEKKIAVVTGANRGIGKEISRQLAELGFQVIMTARDFPALRQAAQEVGHLAVPFRVDVSNPESISLFSNFMRENYPVVDVLVNNAGILDSKPMLDFDIDAIELGMETNFLGPIRITKVLFPLLEKSKDARIINISSIMAAKDELLGGSAAYRLSKWSLNGFTVLLANELRNSHIKVFAAHPGWVMTQMGGAGAIKTVAEGADTPVWLATANEDELMNGWFYADRRKIQY